MIVIKNKKLEKAFNKRIIPGITCLGIDAASRTGWCKIETDLNHIKLDYAFIDIKSKDRIFKYNQYLQIFNSFPLVDRVIIEESYYSRNVKGFQMLSRLSGIIYAVLRLRKVEDISFILASTARKNLGLKGTRKKEIVHKEFSEKLETKLKDPDVIDAFILALNGILEDYTL